MNERGDMEDTLLGVPIVFDKGDNFPQEVVLMPLQWKIIPDEALETIKSTAILVDHLSETGESDDQVMHLWMEAAPGAVPKIIDELMAWREMARAALGLA